MGGRYELLLACEAKRLVRSQAPRVHGSEYRHSDVGVVVDADARFPVVGSHEATGVLDEPAFERDGEGEEEGVELGAVEALSEVLAGRDHDERLVSRGVLDLVEKSSAGAFS